MFREHLDETREHQQLVDARLAELGAHPARRRTARRAGDEATAGMAERILAGERRAAERVAGTWDAAVEATLHAQSVASA